MSSPNNRAMVRRYALFDVLAMAEINFMPRLLNQLNALPQEQLQDILLNAPQPQPQEILGQNDDENPQADDLPAEPPRHQGPLG